VVDLGTTGNVDSSPVAAAIAKSSRHSKITGDFAELLVLYWLSKSGYECAKIDHTGIDLMASIEAVRIGISVQSRSRLPHQRTDHVNLHEFEKACAACKPFGLEPYVAIVVDRGTINCYLLALDHLETLAGGKKTRTWRMDDTSLEACHKDPKIARFELTGCSNWRNGRTIVSTMVSNADAPPLTAPLPADSGR
jgi:hypothetical protein